MKHFILFVAVLLTGTTADMVPEDEIECPVNFVPNGQSCYYFSALTALNFTDAINDCRARNAKIAVPRDAEENAFFVSYIKGLEVEYGVESWWIGGTDYGKEGNWVGVSMGCGMTFTDWCSGEPNNYGGENCLAFRKQCNYKWEDRSCDYTGYRHICHIDIVSPTTA